ncbi:MAG: 4Fe-4S dicluster domain-containing protein, partial [Planctomycetota bacterium]|jgi:ferredoxin
VLSLAGGVVAVPAVRLSNKLGDNWYHKVIRPPGALAEKEFLKRCIKCGQCMRVCPTNVLQPGGIVGGLENLWTPALNNRIGSSGCQLNCVACGQVCPTSAIRPITLAEKLGEEEFADVGPIKLGTAFFDRNRCLPWAMDKPCIVCEENCPLSPKAIYQKLLIIL